MWRLLPVVELSPLSWPFGAPLILIRASVLRTLPAGAPVHTFERPRHGGYRLRQRRNGTGFSASCGRSAAARSGCRVPIVHASRPRRGREAGKGTAVADSNEYAATFDLIDSDDDQRISARELEG